MSRTPFLSNPRHPVLPTEGCDSCENLAERVRALEECCDDVQEELEGKQDTLIAGDNITIVDNVISASGGGGSSNVLVNTKENWDSQRHLIGQKDVVYVYTNQYTNEYGEDIPGFKVGDGLAYLIDLPFNDDIMARHIADTNIHVTLEEKECWSNKVTCFMDANDLENLVFTKNCI